MRLLAAGLLCPCLALASAALAAPEWTRAAGLDVWNAGRDRDAFRATASRQDELDAAGEAFRRRAAATAGVARRLSDGHLPPARAVDEALALMEFDPGCVRSYRLTYESAGLLPEGACDRRVVACYLSLRLQLLTAEAEHAGDHERATAIAYRRALFDTEWSGDRARDFHEATRTASVALARE